MPLSMNQFLAISTPGTPLLKILMLVLGILFTTLSELRTESSRTHLYTSGAGPRTCAPALPPFL